MVIPTAPKHRVMHDNDPDAPTRAERRDADRNGGHKMQLLSAEDLMWLGQRTKSSNPFVAARARLTLHFDTRRRYNFAKRAREGMARGGVEPLKSSRRGLDGEFGGRTGPVTTPTEFRNTTLQAAGMWPFPVGAGAPLVGVPLGSHLYTHAPVCFDPLSWMTRAKFIGQPSMMLLGLPSFGKSSLARMIMLGLIATGVTALVLGDMRPDYRKLVEALPDGQVIELGLGLGTLNPLDMGPLAQILPVLRDAVADRTARAAHARESGDTDAAIRWERGAALADKKVRQVVARITGDRLRRVKGLLELTRGKAVADFEEAATRAALEVCDERARLAGTEPQLGDLYEVLAEGPATVRAAYVVEADDEYTAEVRPLLRTLNALRNGSFGEVFDHATSQPIDINASAICIDVSGIEASDRKLKGAVLLTCWEHGFASIAAAHFLADAGCGPKRNFLAVLDEMWQVLRAGVGMVDRVDELTRLNRNIGTALLMCTHTVSDLISLPRKEDRVTAQGFIERAAALIVGALPRKEMARLADIKPFTDTEINDITSWSSPPALTGDARSNNAPPGRGKFYIKVGEQGAPGLPFRTVFSPSEIESGIHDTNHRFDMDQEWAEMNAEWSDDGADRTPVGAS